MCAPPPAAAQQTLERWLDDLLPRSPWVLATEVAPAADDSQTLLDPTSRPAISTALELHRLGLGPWSLRRQEAGAELWQPLASPDLGLHMRVSHRVDSRLDLGGGEVWSEDPSAFEADVTARLDAWPGRWAMRLGGGWEGGYDWSASVAGESRFHRILAAHASTRDPGLRLTLPAADVDGASLTSSSVDAVTAEARWPAGRLRGTGLTLTWARESFTPRSGGGGPELRPFVTGHREEKGIGVRLRLFGPLTYSVGFHTSRIGSDGSLTQSEQRAGRLFFGRLLSEAWTVTLDDAAPDRPWSGSFTWGRADGSLSARLETWPFREVWEQLGAIAYRVRGDLRTRWQAMTLFRRPSSAEGWSLGVERLRLALDGEDWLVTGLGFGRSDHRSVNDLEGTVVMVGGELRRPLPGTSARAAFRLTGSVPVHAWWNAETDEALGGSGWVGGAGRWASVTLGFSWY